MSSATMPAVVQYALAPGSVELREVPRPGDPGDDEVLLAPRGVGVCGSEIHQWHNTQSWPVNVPVILGQEFCGVIAAVGRNVRGFREGDRVASETAARICGACFYCRTGEYNLCPKRLGFGYGLDGALAELVRVPARCLHHLPASVSFEMAALTEPCCVAYNATCVKTKIQAGDTVLVLGPGPIGLISLAMARLSGAGWLGMVGLAQDAKRLALAQQLGADATMNADEQDPLEIVRSLGEGFGVDVVIDASGASAALKLALAAVRPAGQISKVGWGPQPLNFSLDLLVGKAVRLQGSFSHNYPIWERVIALMAGGMLDPTPLIGRVEPLAQWRACFEAVEKGDVVKAVLRS
jgi:alcohol dehydrogenase/L-iditol 2-dehydrogenase